jgi:hypothetical protein
MTAASWGDTPAGLIRNQGWYADDVALAKAREFNSPERRAARAAFDAAWGDPGRWGVDGEGRLVNARSVQEELAARGWQGGVGRGWAHDPAAAAAAVRGEGPGPDPPGDRRCGPPRCGVAAAAS